MWATPGHHSPHEIAIKSNHGQATLQDSSTPPDTGVTKPMSDKSSTHEIKRAVFECPFYIYKNTQSHFFAGQAPSQPEPQADEVLFPWISQPGKHAGWDAVALKSDPHSLKICPLASPWS